MLKTKFTYCAISLGRFQRNYKIVKKLSRSGKKSTAKDIESYCKNFLSSAAGTILKASAVAGIAIAMSFTASAQQCDTFYNADAANPIHVKGLPKFRDPYFVDIDGDGDYDCYALDYFYSYKAPMLFKNIGTNKLPVYKYEADSSGFAGDLSFASTNTAFVDIDGDGDYDCFIAQAYTGNFGGVRIKYFENVGTTAKPVYVENEAANPLRGEYGFYSINFTFADIDGDGDLDAYVFNDYDTFILFNEGTKTSPNFVQVSSLRDASESERTYYDWNHDGLLDYFNNSYSFGFHYYKNIGPKSNPSYVIDDTDGPHFYNGSPHQFTNIIKDGASEVFNREGGFSTLAAVPVVTTSTTVVGGKTYTKLTVAPTSTAYAYTSRWYLNGVLIPRATDSSLVAIRSGIYSATIIDTCGTGVALPIRVTYPSNFIAEADDKTGISSFNALPAITAKAYPNPFTSSITIRLPAAKSAAKSTIQVMDISGKIMLTETTSASSITIGETLSAGAYMVQVTQGSVLAYHTIILKQ